MAARRSAALVATATSPCAGILTPKDVLFKVVAKGKSAGEVRLEEVMTRSPDTMLASATVVEALHQLQCICTGFQPLRPLRASTPLLAPHA